MNISNNERVRLFFTDLQLLSMEQFEVVTEIRKVFLKSNVCLVEDIKYGGLTFNLDGGLVGGIFTYKEHISIEFSHGVDFTDPEHILEGKGKRRRHVKIHSSDDIIHKKCEYFIYQASNRDKN